MRFFVFIGTGLLAIACAAPMAEPSGDASADAALGDEQSAMTDAASGLKGVFCGASMAACKGYGDCCSGECVADVDATQGYCLSPASACAANQATCTDDSQCCSGSCVNGTCAAGCTEVGLACTPSDGGSSGCCTSEFGIGTNLICDATNGCSKHRTVNVIIGPSCRNNGEVCENSGQCCTNLCANGTCAASTCAAHGTKCSNATDCCSNACVNGVCADHPSCVWSGSCSIGKQCCSGVCNGNTCAPPVATQCRYLKGDGLAACYDCIADKCCADKTNGSPLWQGCFDNCMASSNTWDAYSACTNACASTAGAPSNLDACVAYACKTECAR